MKQLFTVGRLPLCWAMIVAAPGFAQAPSSRSDEALAQELQDLLNAPIQGASKREQRLLESPQAIEVLTGDELRKMGVYRLQDALKLMTGVDILDPDNNFTGVGMRGVMQQGQPRTVQVLIDGVPLYNSFASSMDLGNLPVTLDSIDRIEVVRGPSSTLYGANAVVGVISITTRKAGEGVHGSARLASADHGTSRWEGGLAVGQGPWGVSAGYSGFSLGTTDRIVHQVNDPVTPYSTDSGHYSDASHNHSENVRVDWKNDHTSLWFSQGGAAKKNNVSQGLLNRWFDVQTLLAGWHETWSPSFATELRVHQVHQDFYFRMADSSSVPYGQALALLGHTPINVSGDSRFGDNTATQVELQGNWDPGQDLHFVFGADARSTKAKAVPFLGLDKDDTETASGGFLSMDWKFQPQWTLSLGARLENETLGGSRTSPRATLLYALSPSTTLRAGFYTSTRSPQLAEMRTNYYFGYSNASIPGANLPLNLVVCTIIPNAQIKPEKTSNLELGFRQNLGPVSLDFTVYRMAITSQITQVLSGVVPQIVNVPMPAPYPPVVPESVPVYINQFQNRGDSTNKGAELAVTYLFRKDWSFGMNGRYLDYSQDSPSVGAAFPNGEFSYAPKHLATIWTRFAQGGFSGYFDVQHVAAAHVEGLTATGFTLAGERPAYLQWDGQVSYELVRGFSIGAYARNAGRNYTLQGASGPERPPYLQSLRREFGASVAYRF